MILGRNPALWLAAIAAMLNVAVIVFGVPLSMEGLAACNVLAASIIGLVANAADPTTSPTFALTMSGPATGSAASSAATGSSLGATTSPSVATPTDPTPAPSAGDGPPAAGG